MSTQPLKMSTRKFLGVTTLPPWQCRMSRRSRSLNLLEPQEPHQACIGKPLPLPLLLSVVSRNSDSLRAGRSGHRIPVEARFSAPVQTGLGAHRASYIMGTTGSFPGVKWPGRGVYHSPPCSAEVKERVELYLYSPSGPPWPIPGWSLLLLLSVRV